VFSLLLLGIGLSLALYGKWFFGSNELISGGTREYVMSKTQPVRAQRQMSLKQGANPSDDQISKYCTCVSIQIADNTTYKRLASDSTAPDVRTHWLYPRTLRGVLFHAYAPKGGLRNARQPRRLIAVAA
jgi:hypothetical protein